MTTSAPPPLPIVSAETRFGRGSTTTPAQGQIRYQAVAVEDDCCGAGGALGFGRDGDVDGNYFAGWLDDVALFDRALGTDEISVLAVR